MRRKTKIVCTLGPNTRKEPMLRKLAIHGMDVARFNFSHDNQEIQGEQFTLLEKVRKEVGRPIAALLDTRGPEIRTGLLEDGKKVMLNKGDAYTLTTVDCVGNASRGFINYSGLPADVHAGNRILIDDGLIELEVIAATETDIQCVVLNGGELGERKGVNVPNVVVNLPSLTDKDKEDISFGADLGFDIVAASFVRNAACIQEIRDLLKGKKSQMLIIAKIENAEGIKNINEIIEAADGIMVARGDLGVEMPAQQIPHYQKKIIQKCNAAGKLVITATQMLDSMIRNPRPTRAEVTDVANAIYDGTDAIMLSGETAAGKYPVEALQMMDSIAVSTEKYLDKEFYEKRAHLIDHSKISNSVCLSTVMTADAIGAKSIIAPSMTGFTPLLLSKWRCAIPVVGVSPHEEALRRMMLYWGVTPVFATREKSTDAIIRHAIDAAREAGLVQEGDIVVATAGIPDKQLPEGDIGETNNMLVQTV